MVAQGCSLKEKILHQDNQSSIELKLNGKKWSEKKTRHANMCFF